MTVLIGAKGKAGDSGSTQSPNTLRSAAMITLVEALGEGKIKGLSDMVNPLKSVYMDGTPMMNADGSINKNGIAIQLMLGQPDQAGFPGNTRTGNLVSVEQQVKIATGPVTKTISGTADRVQVNVRIPALAYQNKDTGDLTGTSLSWLVQRRATGGDWVTIEDVQIINQKNTSPYNRKTIVDRPDDDNPFDIRVVRSTPDSDDVALQNDIFWESYTVLVLGKYSYPNVAAAQLLIDTQAFGDSLGELTFEVDGIESDIPSNYDAIAKTYAGVWDGTFVRGWHSNPAWVFWDLVTNNRYGLGEFVNVALIDKWTLYQIARYCDGLVPSGFNDSSGDPILEPRFTFNGTISDRQEAYKVLQDITAAFRGMAYWSLGQVFCSNDMPQDPVTTLTPANVIGGRFGYSGTAMKSRHSVALVSWNDPADGYRQQIEVVQNNAMLSRFGWRQIDVAMRGCTSRGEAFRFGKWILDTEQNETETVQFSMSWDGYVLQGNNPLQPGNIILIEDPRKNGGFRNGGRFAAVHSASELVFDFPVDTSDTGYTLTAMLPSGALQKRTISGFSLDKKTVTLATPFTETPSVNGNWILESNTAHARRYRVMSIEENEDNIFKVTALFNDPNKYARVEENYALEPIQYVRPRNVVRAPTNVTSAESRYFQNGASHSRLTLSWQVPDDFLVASYTITADSPRGFQAFPTTVFPSIDINDPVAGDWKFYISAKGVTGVTSVPTEYDVTLLGWQAVDGPIPDDLQTTAGDNTFAGRAPTITWTNTFPPDSVEYPVTNIIRIYDASTSALLRTETVSQHFYTYTYENNINDGGPRRSVRIDITAKNVTGAESSPASITVTNPIPAAIVPTVRGDVGSIDVSWVNTDNDYAGAFVWASLDGGFSPTIGNQLYQGPDTSVSLNLLAAGTWFVWVAIYDAFGTTGLHLSTPISVTINDLTTALNAVASNLATIKDKLTLKDAEDIQDAIAEIVTQMALDRDAFTSAIADGRQLLSLKSDQTNLVLGNVSASLTQEQYLRVTGDTAEVAARLALEAIVGTNTAAIATESTARATADTSLASTITALAATVGSNTAAIATEATARASGDSAVASTVTTLSTTVAGHTSSISTVQSSVNGISLEYGVIGTINGVTGGFIFSGITKLDGSVSYSVEIQGSLVVDGTISAAKLNVTNLAAIKADLGTVTAGRMLSPSGFTDFDLTNERLIFSDST